MALIRFLFGIGVVEYPVGRPHHLISVAWSCFNCMIYVGFISLTNLMDFKDVDVEGSFLAAINSYIKLYGFTSLMLISIFLSHRHKKAIDDNYRQLDYYNKKLGELGIPKDYELMFRTQRNILIIAFIVICILVGFNYVRSAGESSHVYNIYLIYTLTFNLIIDSVFVTTIRYVQNRFVRLNSVLIRSTDMKKRNISISMVTDNPHSLFSHFTPLITNISDNPPREINNEVNKQWLLYIIGETRKIHRGLCQVSTKINELYSNQMVLLITWTYGITASTSYSLYLMITSECPHESNCGIIDISYFIMWIWFHLGKLALVFDACANTRFEAQRTGEVIHMLVETSFYDKDVRDQINLLSIQLIKNPLDFTVYGLFQIDSEGIARLALTIVTLLVIMIQLGDRNFVKDADDPENGAFIPPISSTFGINLTHSDFKL
ncbi:putative gustatory receptor 28a isoform X2 [Athalia rosae]|nr:putative gustatory receptor 28a isoform X2 [Athalia rosae]